MFVLAFSALASPARDGIDFLTKKGFPTSRVTSTGDDMTFVALNRAGAYCTGSLQRRLEGNLVSTDFKVRCTTTPPKCSRDPGDLDGCRLYALGFWQAGERVALRQIRGWLCDAGTALDCEAYAHMTLTDGWTEDPVPAARIACAAEHPKGCVVLGLRAKGAEKNDAIAKACVLGVESECASVGRYYARKHMEALGTKATN